MTKNKIWVLLCTLVTSCTLIESSSFRYLDDENLELHPMQIMGAEQDVEISLPRGLVSRLPTTLFMQPGGLKLAYTKALDVRYEWLWRNPVHKGEDLYLFGLAFRFAADRHLLSASIADRINTEKVHYANYKAGSWRDDVLEKTGFAGYRSKQGYQWVVESLPATMHKHEVFSLPISDERQLVIWFWYNKDWAVTHPVWYQRRKTLSRRILNSVRLLGLH